MNNMNDKNFDLVMPAAKKLILENDIDINIIKGTGKEGRITKGDVLLILKSNGISQKLIDNKNQEENLNINENRKGSTMDIIVPTLGESIVEATVSKWLKNEGEYVEVDEPVVELETDKVTLEVPAPISGVIGSIIAAEGETVEVGQNIGVLDPSRKKTSDDKPKAKENNDKEVKQLETKDKKTSSPETYIKKDDAVKLPINQEEIVPMSRLRQAIASRLKSAQNTAAILTTYNEVDMTALMKLRSKYQPNFEKKFGIKLGYMSFFVKACINALKVYPAVNAEIRDNNTVYKNYYNIGVAVGTPEGLVVPVLKNAEDMDFPEIEKTIANFGKQAREGNLTIQDMSNGTFTISNGGVYGSMLSSPILNPPQSGILGMHNIQKRAVVIDDKVEIRSMMYLALSYDHRIIDGREAVSFLVNVKENLEDPQRMLIGV
ncbi:MAG: dihydrolipoyllysine-residue succinyltransferase [Candidatus Puniceispirillales bacterium]